MSRIKIEKKVYTCAFELLQEKGFVSPIDLLVKMERIATKQVEEWRFGRIPYLERAATGNLAKLNHILMTLRKFAKEQNLNLLRPFTCLGEKGQSSACVSRKQEASTWKICILRIMYELKSSGENLHLMIQ
ncbi:hypothetical protein [Bacillus methanolicus]|uniref:hypothetical protein n=1 Tax=Bacillus methanolicus TaxID=1471 RepID=UPI0023802854|nr:hypothetical protein [Bacillus methanolicus]